MRHLDDGQIAEWIDSAGRQRGGGAGTAEAAGAAGGAAEVARHLAECVVCRERAEEARAIADQAKAILGGAAPAAAVVPPFEEVLHRAGRARRKGLSLVWRRLAVAATVVIAGGLGWYARGQFSNGESAVPAIASPPAEAVVATAPTGLTLADSGRPTQEVEEPAVTGTAEGRATRLARPTTLPSAGAGTQAAQAPPADERAAQREELAAVERDQRGNEAQREAAPPAAARADAPPVMQARAQAPAEPGAFAAEKSAVTPSWIPVTRARAEALLGDSLLLVDGLPLIGIEAAPPTRAVRIRQSLGPDRMLELVEEAGEKGETGKTGAMARRAEDRAAAAPAVDSPIGRFYRLATPVEAADTVLVNGIRVIGRAPVSPDSLRVLLRKLRT